MANQLVDLLKMAVGLPTGKSGSCCTTVPAEQAAPAQACCTSTTAKADSGSCCK